MSGMSMFLASLGADPEEQRFNKATIYLRTLRFGRLSDDHVIALAVLHELGGVYRRAYGTAQVLHPAPYGAQEEALRSHLRALGLPCSVEELEPHELRGLLTSWQEQYHALLRPFDATLRAFLEYAETQLNKAPAQLSVPDHQEQEIL